MLFLRQSTSVSLKIGPFLDDTDFKTAETGLTISQADVRLSKAGSTFDQKNSATSCSHEENGWYNCPLSTTDTGELGKLHLAVHVSGALPVGWEFQVIPANVYDSMYSTDKLQVDMVQVSGATQSATDLKDFADTGYDPATNKVQGVVLVDTTTTNTDMVGTDNAALASVCTEARLAELAAANLPADVDAVLADTNELQTDWANGGRLDLLIDLILADTAELQTDWVNSGRLDALIDAIKAKTDLLAAGSWLSTIEGAANSQTFLGRTIDRIRDATDEPSTNSKWTDTKLLDLIETAYAKVYAEVNRVSKRPIICQADLSIVSDKDRYILPPVIGKIICIQGLNDSGGILWYYWPSDHRNPGNPGIVLEGNTLYLQETPTSSTTFRILYIPDNCIKLHADVIAGSDITNNVAAADNDAVIQLPAVADITVGSMDLRPHAYVGSIFRMTRTDNTATDFEQDRIINAYDVTTRQITVSPAYPTALLPASGDEVIYEIVPMVAEQLELAIALYVSRYIIGVEGDTKRYTTINIEYERAIREVRMKETHYDMVLGHFQRIASVYVQRVITGRSDRLDRRSSYS